MQQKLDKMQQTIQTKQTANIRSIEFYLLSKWIMLSIVHCQIAFTIINVHIYYLSRKSSEIYWPKAHRMGMEKSRLGIENLLILEKIYMTTC